MKVDDLIDKRVHDYYWNEDLNCATTMLKILGEIFNVELCSQLINSAIGMHGAGRFGAQCGLVEGSLMFLGIISTNKGNSYEEIEGYCYNFADEFQNKYGSLVCRELRPQGFKSDNPTHLCEDLTKRAVKFTRDFIIENNLISA